ncbi:hypothetical protein K7432_015760 [Basidiobolus ranarum]|uniref:1-alkyl-2-acetylglycerophosphocholine esterase n=1 Tax=Basidiobolus ranarum TaxID=34480 RepID=A0ABR2WFQ9_9FUNG
MMNIKSFTVVALLTASITFVSSKLSLPDVTGKFKVGTVNIQLIDHTRVDPYASDLQKRALMVQLFYPTKRANCYPISPYMPELTGQLMNQLYGLPNGTLQAFQTQAHIGAPIAQSNSPIVLFSPGAGMSRYLYTSLLTDIASRGYLVVAIDHPYDAQVVEFPDGKLIKKAAGMTWTTQQITEAEGVRAQDVSFILDQLNTLKIRNQIPALRTKLNVRRVVMFGHSLGGATAAAAMLNDTRIIAGANLDGSFWGPVTDRGLDRPFLIMGLTQHNRGNDASWAKIWPNLRSWRLQLKLANSGHLTYSDMPIMANLLNMTNPELESTIGTINGLRSLVIQRTYISAFLERTFSHSRNPILQRPDSRFPEITFEI